ncbi:MAG TPA: DUF3556 domain-containing protein [Polyangiaceae bacterium]
MFLAPIAPPYDPLEWAKKPFPEKARMVCEAWALQGYGTPLVVYLVYALKVVLYVAGWLFFCRFTPGLGGVADLDSWWLAPDAFKKAVLWSMLFEGLGLGCGSGPLTGRYLPPIGGALYFLRPGTTKLPVFEGAPLIGGSTRSWLDVVLYAASVVLVIVSLVSPHPGGAVLVAIAVLVPLLALLDKTLFLALRGEHFWTTLMVFVLAADFVPGAKAIQAALWFWAGVSKLNHHFPSVVGVMTSNSPLTRFAWLRKLMYRSYPDDLNPSRLATYMGHAGTVLELSVPVILLSAHGGTATVVGLVLMLMLHGFITSNVPMGVPIEWNVIMVYGGFFLFYKHADASLFSMTPVVALLVTVMCVLVPLVGNFAPARVPFLLAMRYYAGNWAYSVWLFRGQSHEKLRRLTTSSAWIYDQLGRLYDRRTCVGIVGKVMAFRLMHLHGRLLTRLVPKAIAAFDEYEWIDGELVAGMVLGWNFGDGHLHREQLLRAVQGQCGFEEGELRCVMVEAQPLWRPTLHYRILDAKSGLLEEGDADVRSLRNEQPWGGASPDRST